MRILSMAASSLEVLLHAEVQTLALLRGSGQGSWSLTFVFALYPYSAERFNQTLLQPDRPLFDDGQQGILSSQIRG
jgi:hypothetical protein